MGKSTDRTYERALTAALGITFGIVFFDRNTLNYLMPFVLREIALTNTQVGLIASGLALSWAASGMVAGRLADRLGRRKPLLLVAVIAFSLCSFVTGMVWSFATLLAARLLMGFAEGPVLPISQSLIAEASAPERRGLNMGLMQNVLSNLMGSLVAPLVVVALANAYGWRTAFLGTIFPGLVVAFFIWRYVREPGRAAAPAHGEAVAATPCLASVSRRNVRLCMVISPLMVGWMITGWVFLPIYFTTVLGFTATRMSVLMSMLGITGALAGFAVPALSDRFGRRPVIVAGCLLGVVTPLAVLTEPGMPLALTLLVATGWMAAGTFSIFMATVPAESADVGRVATAMALTMGFGELLGGAGAPAAAGWLADRFGLAAPLVLEAALASTAALFAFGLIETAPRRLAVRS